MILRVKIELGNLTPYPLHAVIGFISAIRYRLIRDIGYAQTDISQFSLHLAQFILGCLQCCSQAGNLFQQRLNIFSCSLCLANGLGSGVALILQRLGVDLQRLSFFFQ